MCPMLSGSWIPRFEAECARARGGLESSDLSRCGGFLYKSTIFRLLAKNNEFLHQYAREREIQAEGWADELVAIM